MGSVPFLQCAATDNRILSPGVGTFYRDYPGIQHVNDRKVIGVLVRFNAAYALISSCEDFVVTAVHGSFVMVGDELAIVEVSDRTPENTPICATDIEIQAPSDGFISITDMQGEPLKKAGDVLHKGDVIATLEFMKIRMDIEFAGPDGSVFTAYAHANHEAVRKGCCIAKYRSSSSIEQTEN